MKIEVPSNVFTHLGKEIDLFARDPNQYVLDQAKRESPDLHLRTTKNLLLSVTPLKGTAAALGTLLLVGLGLALFWTRPTSNVYAFGQVIEEIKRVRSYSFHQYIIKDGTETLHARVYWRDPGMLRTVEEGGDIQIFNSVEAKLLHLMPEEKKAMLYNVSPVMSQELNAYHMERLTRLDERTSDFLGTTVLEGERVRVFRVDYSDLNQTWLVWADEETELPVRIEVDHNSPGNIRTLLQDFRFGEELDDSLFSVEPPGDCKLVQYSTPIPTWSEIDSENLLSWLRVLADLSGGYFPGEIITNPTEESLEGIPVDLLNALKEKPVEYQRRAREHAMKAMMFLVDLNSNGGSWRFTGEGVPVGDRAKAVLWWSVKDSEVYQVVYGDLSVRAVPKEAFVEPKGEAGTYQEIKLKKHHGWELGMETNYSPDLIHAPHYDRLFGNTHDSLNYQQVITPSGKVSVTYFGFAEVGKAKEAYESCLSNKTALSMPARFGQFGKFVVLIQRGTSEEELNEVAGSLLDVIQMNME